jgi:hypothetical protein
MNRMQPACSRRLNSVEVECIRSYKIIYTREQPSLKEREVGLGYQGNESKYPISIETGGRRV